MLAKKLNEIQIRKTEIRSALESGKEINLDEVKTELESLESQEIEIRAKMEMAKNVVTTEHRTIEKPENTTSTANTYDEAKEYRSAFYKTLMNKPLTATEKRAMDTTTGSSGYAIPDSLTNAIYRTFEAQSALYALVKKTFVKGNFSVLKADPSTDVSWHTENAPVSSDDSVNPVKVTFGGFELIKVIGISKSALTMTIDSFEAYLANEIAIKMVKAIEAAIISGGGTTTPKGILTESLTEVNFTTDITYAKILEALGTLKSSFAPNAKFTMNRKTFYTQVLGMVDADGEPIVQPDVTAPAKFSLLGVPVVLADMLADNVVILGNFDYYQINFQEGVSIERNDSAGFTSGTVYFRGYANLDGKCIDKNAFIKICAA